MSVIVHAKELQEKEAAKNASILLQQVDMEKEREEVKKQAAARRRERKKRKKKIKMAGKEENDKMAGKDEDCEDDEETMVIMKEESEGDQQEKSQGRWGRRVSLCPFQVRVGGGQQKNQGGEGVPLDLFKLG